VVAKLLLAGEERHGRYLVLCGLREDQHEAIEHVLTHHGLAVTALRDEGGSEPRLLGWVTADARAAFECLCERGDLEPADLAGALDWPSGRAEAALEALAGRRLVRTDGDRYRPLPTE
jgi:hypothetical protein